MKGKDLILIGAGVFILIEIAKKTQAAAAGSIIPAGTAPNTSGTPFVDSGGGYGSGIGGGGAIGGGGFLGGGGGWNPIAAAWAFADWVNSIPVGGQPYANKPIIVNVPPENS